MAGNIQADSNGDIYVEFDNNNIIVVDPNKTIDNFGNIKERLVDHENLVMYANLEVNVMPRTKLLVGTSVDSDIQNISIAKMNFLKPNADNFMNVGYYDELTGLGAVDQSGQNQAKKTINTNSQGQTYIKLSLNNEDNVIDNGMMGMTSIEITTNSSFVPAVKIELEDVQGKALFQLGDKSPYATFFSLPYPPFILTLKGYYGKAIRYQLNLKDFQARFNSGTGNYQVTLQFVGFKFNILTEVAMGHLLATPHMYSQSFVISSNPQQLQTNNTSAQFSAGAEEKIAGSASNSQDSLVTSITSEKGYQKIREVYSEYKAKGLIPKDLPELTLMELLNKIETFETLITASYPSVNIEPLTNIRQYQSDLRSYYENIIGSTNSWFSRFLDPRPLVLNDNTVVYVFKKNLSQNGINSAVEELKSIVKKNNLKLAENPTLGDKSKFKISNKIKYELLEYDVTPSEIFWIETIKKQTGATTVTNEDVKLILENYNQLYLNSFEITNGGLNLIKPKFFVFEGKGRFTYEITSMEAQSNKKLQEFETSISAELADTLQNSETGLGFIPTVRNIIGMIMASAEAFIRLLDEVHTNAWEVKYDPVRKRAILDNPTSAPGTDTVDNVPLDNNASNQNQGLATSQKPVFPWPQFFVETPEDKKGRFQLKYIGDPSVVDLTQGYLYSKWPEVQFVEEYIKGLTQKFSTPQFPTTLENQRDTNQINVNAIEYPQFGLSYLNKQEVKFFYEIWERQFLTAYYTGLVRAVNGEINETLNLIVETEVSNIKESLGMSNPYLTYKLKNYGFNAQNYKQDVLKNFSNQGTGKSYQDFIRDFFVTSYIKSATENSFSILGTLDLGRLPQVSSQNTALETLSKSSNNTPLIVDTFPFTNANWVSENMAGSSTNTGNQVYNTNLSLKVYGPLNILSNFTDVYNFTENRPVTNFSYLTQKTNPTPNNNQFPIFFIGREPEQMLPTEGLISFTSPFTSSIVNRTTSLLNSPFMVNAILNGVESQRSNNPYPYLQAAFLFINSLPLASLKEKYKKSLNNKAEELDYIASVFKKYGAIHKLPYGWVVKIGSIWHRYKKYKQTGIDILDGAWSDFDYETNYSPILSSITQTYSFNYGNRDYNITLQSETDTNISMNLGFYPKVINDFNYFFNGYDLYKDYTNEEIQKSFDVTRIRIIENNSANITGANQSGKNLNETLYSVIIPELNIFNQDINCDANNNTTDSDYYIVPSFGSNVNQAYFECIGAKTSVQTTVTPFTNNSSIYNGSVRTFWAAPNYGYFNVGELVKPQPDEYINEFKTGQGQQYPFKLLRENKYSKIEEVFSVFEKSMLDQLEQEFLDFSKGSGNLITRLSTVSFNESNVDNMGTFRNFQSMMKSMMTIVPQTKNPQNQSQQDYFNSIVDLQLENISSTIKGFMNYDVIIRYGNPSNYRRRIFDSYRSYNSVTKYVVDPITFNPYIPNTLPTTNGNLTVSQSKSLNPSAWLALELEVGFSTIPELRYSPFGSYITDFFIDNNIEFTEANVTLLSPIIKMYATQKLNGLNVSQFKESLNDYLLNTENLQNNFLTLILNGLNAQLPNQSQVPEGTIKSAANGAQNKVELYETFKALNDKWIAGGNYSDKTIFEDMLFLDRASRNISDIIYLDIFDLKDVLNKNAINETMDVYTFIASILIRNNFTVMNLPAYINFYNVQNVGESTTFRQEGSLEFANTLWGTFLDVDYRRSSQKMVCFYAGKPSEHLSIVNSGYRSDGIDFTKPDNPLYENLQNKSDSDYALSNRCVGFTVDIGIRNQNIFHTFSIDQKPGKATSESIATFLDMVDQASGRNTSTQNVGLYNLYKTRSYECTVSCLGNALIQPTMYFNLRHVPLFNGAYMITEVNHSIQPGSFNTVFKGTRQGIYDLPALNDLLQQINRNLLTKIEEIYKTRKDTPATTPITNAQSANNVPQNSKNTIAEQNSCQAKLDVAYTERQFVSKETTRTELTPIQFVELLNNRFGNNIFLKTTIYCMCYVRTFEKVGNTGDGKFYGYDNNFITLPLTKNYGDVGFNIFNRTYSCVNIKPNTSEPIANFGNTNDFLSFMESRLTPNLRRIGAQGLLKYYVCGWNGVSEDYYNANSKEFTELKENFQKSLQSAVKSKLLTEEEARALGIDILLNENKQSTSGPKPTPTPSPNPPLPGQDCPPPIISSFSPLSGTTGKIIQINGDNLITTNKITVNNIEVDMRLTQIFNNQTLRFSVPNSTVPLPQVGKIKIFTEYGSVESNVNFTHI